MQFIRFNTTDNVNANDLRNYDLAGGHWLHNHEPEGGAKMQTKTQGPPPFWTKFELHLRSIVMLPMTDGEVIISILK